MRRIETVIFDLDGTLIDSRVDIVSGINHMLGRLGMQKKSFEEITGLIGFGVERIVRDALGRSGRDKVKRGLGIFKRYYSRHLFDNTILYPAVRDTLKYIRAKRKRIALLTNRPKASTLAILKYFGISAYFDLVKGGDDQFCMKPGPCPVLNVIKTLGSESSSALMVGDSYIDIEAGKRAGILTCGATYGIGKLSDIKRVRPNYMINGIVEIKKIVI